MSMRIFSLGILTLAAAGCGEAPEAAPPPHQEAEVENVVSCAVDGSSIFQEVCAVERELDNGGVALTVRHPDGGFRRFIALEGPASLESADGAYAAAVAIDGDSVEAQIDGDRYRIPSDLLDPNYGGD